MNYTSILFIIILLISLSIPTLLLMNTINMGKDPQLNEKVKNLLNGESSNILENTSYYFYNILVIILESINFILLLSTLYTSYRFNITTCVLPIFAIAILWLNTINMGNDDKMKNTLYYKYNVSIIGLQILIIILGLILIHIYLNYNHNDNYVLLDKEFIKKLNTIFKKK